MAMIGLVHHIQSPAKELVESETRPFLAKLQYVV